MSKRVPKVGDVDAFGLADIGVDLLSPNPAKMPLNITNGITNLSEFKEIPSSSLIPYRKKDPYDIVDKADSQYRSFVLSVYEKGIINPIIVRPLENQDDEPKFEILEGHHRWEASKDCKLKKIPAKIIVNCSDDDAEDIYRISNLLRKKQSIRDLAYGWWHYFNSTRYQSDEDIKKLIEEGIISEELDNMVKSQSTRQLRRYARLHELIDELLVLVEKKKISIKFAVQLSYLPPKHQTDLLPYSANLKDENKAKSLKALSDGKIEGRVWSKEAIHEILFPDDLTSSAKTKQNKQEFIQTVREWVPKEYHDENKLLDLIREALTKYFTE